MLQAQVDGLMSQIADEAGLELNLELPSGAQTAVGASTQASTEQVPL